MALINTEKPVQKNEKISENIVTVSQATAENFIMSLQDSINEIEEFKEYVSTKLNNKFSELERFENETINLFNSLLDSTKELSTKITTKESYSDYLEEQIKNKDLSKQVILLQQCLNKEKAEVSIFVQEISETINTAVINIENKISELRNVNDIIEENVKKIEEKFSSNYESITKKTIEQLEEFENKHDQSIMDLSKKLLDASSNNENTFKAKCEELITKYTEKCQSHLNTLQETSISFLTQCKTQNENLVKQIPSIEVKNSVSKKDKILFITAVVSIACSLASLIVFAM